MNIVIQSSARTTHIAMVTCCHAKKL